MLDYKLKIGLVPERRWLADAATRRGIFQPSKAVDNKNEIVKYIKDNFSDENTEFVDLEFLNDEGLLIETSECPKVKAEFDVIYRRTYNRLTRPYDGIVKLVADLKAKGILTAVASNKPDEFTQVIVSDMFEAGTFSYVSGKKDGFEKKPDPGIALHIMEKLGVSPEDTLFAGDSSVDMKTATNAGCDSIGCLWGFRTREELEENHAVYIAETPADIYNAAVNGK